MKWYRKLGFDLLLNTAVANAYLLYKDATNKQVSFSKFRKEFAVHLTQFCPTETIDPLSIVEPMIGIKTQHYFERKPGVTHTVRRYCKQCYAENVARLGRTKGKIVTKKVATYCRNCEGQPFLCLPCFNKLH